MEVCVILVDHILCVGYRVYINNSPKALVSRQEDNVVLSDLLPDTNYRFGNVLFVFMYVEHCVVQFT